MILTFRERRTMSLLDQFQQSLLFRWKEMAGWPQQSLWKSFFYLLILIIGSQTLTIGWAFYQTGQIDYRTVIAEMPAFKLTKSTLYYRGDPTMVSVPAFHVTVQIGGRPGIPVGGGNTIVFYRDGLRMTNDGLSGRRTLSYASLPIWRNRQAYVKRDVIRWLNKNRDTLTAIAFLYQYVRAAAALVGALLMVSLIAGVSVPLARRAGVTYRRLWTYSAYGLTLPVLVRTFLAMMDLLIPYAAFLTWAIDMFLVYLVVRHIEKREQAD